MLRLRRLASLALSVACALGAQGADASGDLVAAARDAFASGDLLSGLEKLEAAQKNGPNADALLAEEHVAIQHAYVQLASHDVDEAARLVPQDPRIASFRSRIAAISAAHFVSEERPFAEYLAPTVRAVQAGDPRLADAELARLVLGIRGNDPEKTVADVRAYRAEKLAALGLAAPAIADLRRVVAARNFPTEHLLLAAQLMQKPLLPGAPEAAEGAALLDDFPSSDPAYAEMLWRRGQLHVLGFTTSKSVDELARARVDLTLAKRLYAEPIPVAINVELTRAVRSLSGPDAQRYYAHIHSTLPARTLDLVPRCETDPKLVVPVTLLLREILAMDPGNRAAWEAREKICPEGNEKHALEFIVGQFSAPPFQLKGPTSEVPLIREEIARNRLRGCPVDVGAYFELLQARIDLVAARQQKSNNPADLDLVQNCAFAITLISPQAKLAQEAQAACDKWRRARGVAALFN